MASFRTNRFIGAALTLCVVMVAPAAAETDLWVEADGVIGIPGESYRGGIDTKTRADLARPLRQDLDAPIALEMRLDPAEVPESDLTEQPKFGTPRRIGVHRRLPAKWTVPIRAKDLVWESVPGGGEVGTFSMTSPGARAIRLAIAFEVLPADAEVRFYSPNDVSDAVGPFESSFLLPRPTKKKKKARELFWSPVIQDESIAVEIHVPRWEAGDDVVFLLDRVSHIYKPLLPGFAKGPGDSGSCNRNVACSKKWLEASKAVAMIVYDLPGGRVGQCTGQLIVDGNPSTQKPWFLTAAHCFETKAAARSITFFFDYQQAMCSGGTFPMTQLAGGATLKATTGGGGLGEGDSTLVLVKRDLPADVNFQGISIEGGHVGTKKGASIGHPQGDVRKIAVLKKIRGLVEVTSQGFINSGITHYEVVWKKKTTTEPGSSGSSLMVGKRWPKQFVVGVLSAGFASCNTLSEPDFYGSLKYVLDNFPKFAKQLKLN